MILKKFRFLFGLSYYLIYKKEGFKLPLEQTETVFKIYLVTTHI